MVSETLEVTITAVAQGAEQQVESFREKISDLGQTALSTASALQVLESQVDGLRNNSLGAVGALFLLTRQIDDEGDEAKESAGETFLLSSAISSLTPAASGASISLGVLSVTFQSLTVAIGVVTGALIVLGSIVAAIGASVGALVAGAVALTGAFGLVTGSGLLAFGERLGEQNKERLEDINNEIERLEWLQDSYLGLTRAQEDRLKTLREEKRELEDQTGILGGLGAAFADLRDEIVPIITDFGEQFIPLIEAGIDTLPGLIDEVVDAAGGMDQLKEDIAALGAGFADALPGIISGMIDLAREAIPVFQDFMQFLGEEGPGAIRIMVQTAREIAPEMKSFFNTFIDALPSLIRFGQLLLTVVVPALNLLLSVIKPVVDFLNGLVRLFGEIEQAIPDWLREVVTSGNIAGELLSRAMEFGSDVRGEIVDRGSIQPQVANGANVGRGPGAQAMQIEIQGELRERNGEIVGVIDKRIEQNDRRSSRSVARRTGGTMRGG